MARAPHDASCSIDLSVAPLIAVSAVFSALGRGIVFLDHAFNVVHVSDRIEALLGGERARSMVGRPVEQLLGRDVFGPDGAIRIALAAGEKREGWRAFIEGHDGARPLTISAAPFVPDPNGICDPRVAYIVVARPAEEDTDSGTSAPTCFSGLIGRSSAMARVFGLIENLRSSDATILLTGECGTGKEVVARAIHANSPHRSGPFVRMDCGALPSELLESELFGHVRGAFTSAIRDRVGRFESAARGTLFLDEIGDMPLALQVKLLRVLQERRFERVGETRSIDAEARIVVATSIDLRRAIAEGRFREDLYDRLRTVPIEISPLRERREDIEPLARYLLARVAARHGRELQLSPDALRAMLEYPWPGNVRELENALEYAVSVVKGHTLQIEDLPDEIVHPHSPRTPTPEAAFLPASKDGFEDPDESRLIRQTLERVRWNRMNAARALGMSRTTLWRRMRELHID